MLKFFSRMKIIENKRQKFCIHQKTWFLQMPITRFYQKEQLKIKKEIGGDPTIAQKP